MLSIQFIQENSQKIDIVRNLFLEYSKSLNENLCFQSFDEELENPLKKYGEPHGCLLIAYWNDEPAGCIALQPLKPDGVCEMKRLYVRDNYRRLGIADELVKALLREATKKGYKKMVLDTLERLAPAINLYVRYGFVNTSAYYENPLPNVVYMEKML
jgi:putative acetyltransferase